METTIMGYMIYGDNGQENGNYTVEVGGGR